ncbi:MAG: hypothetical protein EBS01_05705 [Verrucomicrobia bacterium]|nr:hypothetical protein [Verrucomicrobiota bacterium]
MNTTDSTAPEGPQDEPGSEKKQVPCAEQIEFEFAATVTTAPKKKRRRRKASPSAAAGADGANAQVEGRRESRHELSEEAFGDDWIEEVCWNITQAKDLREAVALSACYLAELIDLEVEKRGYCDEWKQAYSAYCSTQLYSLTPEEDESLSAPGLAWAFATLIFQTYERSNELTDWHLFEELCSGEMDLADSDAESPEAHTINLFSSCLWVIHDIVCNGGAEVFAPENSCSTE